MKIKKMKKTVALVMSVLLLFGLTACGNEKQGTDSSEQPLERNLKIYLLPVKRKIPVGRMKRLLMQKIQKVKKIQKAQRTQEGKHW